MKFKALVFDMDGTLLDTLEDLALATNRSLKKHGFPVHPVESYKTFVGSGARTLIQRALPLDSQDEALIEDCLTTFKLYYDEHWADHTHLYEGIAELLNDITEKHLPIAVLTNKPQAFAELCVSKFLGDWSWSAVQGQVDGIPLKPSAEISDRVTQALRVKPDEVLYIGDSNIDMQTAANAGYTSVGVTWGFRSEEELREAGAEYIVHEPSEILRIIEN